MPTTVAVRLAVKCDRERARTTGSRHVSPVPDTPPLRCQATACSDSDVAQLQSRHQPP
jgi:hypothetical protein